MSLPNLAARMRGVAFALAAVVLAARAAGAQGYAFTELGVPGADRTQASGINDSGQVVGNSSSGIFLYDAGVYTRLDAPGAAEGINDAGQVLGYRVESGGRTAWPSYVYDYEAGVVTYLNLPSVPFTLARGINDAGQVVGTFQLGAFLHSAGRTTALQVPGASVTQARGINDAGHIVGYFGGPGGGGGFLYSGGVYTTIAVPGARATQAFGVNDAGQIVGSYGDESGRRRGFLYSAGVFTTIDMPGGWDTELRGINDAGQIVGNVGNFNDVTSAPRAFLATPTTVIPEPATLALVAAGVGLLGSIAVRRGNRGA